MASKRGQTEKAADDEPRIEVSMNVHKIFVRRDPWYARLWRFITLRRADGSEQRPYALLQHAVNAVPSYVPPNTCYEIVVAHVLSEKDLP